jgi:nicotinamidase-related amidase
MRTAFICLDLIHDIAHPEGKIPRNAAQINERGVIAKVSRILKIARDKKWLTIFVKVGYNSGYIDQPKDSPFFGRVHEIGALNLNSIGTQFHSEIDQKLVDLVVVKPRISAFYGTNLEAALRAQKIERLVIAGVSTAWAVQSTVRDAHDRDYQVVVVEDACAASSEVEHQQSIGLLAAISRVCRTDDLQSLK